MSDTDAERRKALLAMFTPETPGPDAEVTPDRESTSNATPEVTPDQQFRDSLGRLLGPKAAHAAIVADIHPTKEDPE